MAKVANNLVTTKLRGMVGGTLVFRSYNGETVVSAAPAPSTKPASEGQQAVREKFRHRITSYNVCYTKLLRRVPGRRWFSER